MASARIDNGATIYNGTRFHEGATFSLFPQSPHQHEIPLYCQIDYGPEGRPVRGFAMHGPQEPLTIGVPVGQPLTSKGINPYTSQPRLTFPTSRPIPYVHGFSACWWNEKTGSYWYFSGGVRIHQVAKEQIWYLKSSYADDGRVSANPDLPGLEIGGKVIFVQRGVVLDGPLGAEAVFLGSCASYQRPGGDVLIPGGPGAVVLKHRGSHLYAPFKEVIIRVGEAKFNPTRWPAANPFLNRQGMVADPPGYQAFVADVDPRLVVMTPDWDRWDAGDLLPLADVPASIQH
jgi:hypothetical protein